MEIKEAYKNIDAIIDDVAKEMEKGTMEFIPDEMVMFFHAQYNDGRETYRVKYHVNGELELGMFALVNKMQENQEFAMLLVNSVKMFMEQMREKQILANAEKNNKNNPNVN